jgi:hypothetical protein
MTEGQARGLFNGATAHSPAANADAEVRRRPLVPNQDPVKRKATIAAARARAGARRKAGKSAPPRRRPAGERPQLFPAPPRAAARDESSAALPDDTSPPPATPARLTEKIRARARAAAEKRCADARASPGAAANASPGKTKVTAAQARAGQVEAARARIEAMSVRDLKRLIVKHGLSYRDCVNKEDVRKRALEAAPRMAAAMAAEGRAWFRKPAPAPSPAPAPAPDDVRRQATAAEARLPPELRTSERHAGSAGSETAPPRSHGASSAAAAVADAFDDTTEWPRSRLVGELRRVRAALASAREEVRLVRQAAAAMMKSDEAFASTASDVAPGPAGAVRARSRPAAASAPTVASTTPTPAPADPVRAPAPTRAARAPAVPAPAPAPAPASVAAAFPHAPVPEATLQPAHAPITAAAGPSAPAPIKAQTFPAFVPSVAYAARAAPQERSVSSPVDLLKKSTAASGFTRGAGTSARAAGARTSVGAPPPRFAPSSTYLSATASAVAAPPVPPVPLQSNESKRAEMLLRRLGAARR